MYNFPWSLCVVVVTWSPGLPAVLNMGLLGNLLSSNVDGVVIELDKEKTPYLIGEKVRTEAMTC